MTRATNKLKKPRRQVRFPGIITDAEILGESLQHLFEVLIGRRPSLRLRLAYDGLKKQQATAKEAQVAA
jgi:hypothetical protein